MITFYVLVSDRLSEKWQSLNFAFVKEMLDAQISQNYTFQVYQLTFSESNRLIVVPVIHTEWFQ